MAWIQLHVYTDPDHAETVEDLLMALGADAVSMDDALDQPLYEPDLGTTPLWNSTRVTGLFKGDQDLDAVQSQLQSLYHAETAQPLGDIEVELLEDREWERAWMDDFQPMRFGQRLWICPSWHTPPADDAVNLMLDPGLAFGTGTHPTTALCLEWLDSADIAGKDVIDYGCGSGILGLAALLLGAKHVIGVDMDPQALEASRENASRNQVADERLDLYLPEAAPKAKADILLANILAQPLMQLAPLLADSVRPGGWIVLSGILANQSDELMQRYEHWFDMEDPAERDGWIRLQGRRHHANG